MDIHGCALDVFCYGDDDGVNFGGKLGEPGARGDLIGLTAQTGTHGSGSSRRNCTPVRTVGSLCEGL